MIFNRIYINFVIVLLLLLLLQYIPFFQKKFFLKNMSMIY